MKYGTILNIKPVGECTVPMPENPKTFLPKEGKKVEFNRYWARRLKSQEIEIVKQKIEKKDGKK